MKIILYIILLGVLALFTSGLIYQYYFHDKIYLKLMGSGVLLMVLVLMPLFIYHRYKDKRIEDYRFKGFGNDNEETK